MTRRGGYTELGMKSLLLQLLKDKEELLKSNQDLVREKEDWAKEKKDLVKKNQKQLEVDRIKKVEANARGSVRSKDPAGNVAIDDQQTGESNMGRLGKGKAGDNNNNISTGQCSRDVNLLQGGDKEAVNDVEEEFDHEDSED